ncbi:hypothetical protein [Streptomyces aculeolatus]|uniref:hypothetical protein n=1 Tax=Streptomyces aculeolatus TaxID=270689 RepID=UPI001CEC70E7|nr:hypothetical protein [Streptomyces aculeolatus]
MSGTAEDERGEAGPDVSGRDDETARGGVRIGNMTGGAVAAGEEARAEDRSRRPAEPAPPAAAPGAGMPGVPPVPAAPPPVVPPPLPGGISIGTMSGGAAAQGPRAQAVDSSVRFVVQADAGALVASLRALRAELLAQPPSETAVADEQELIELENEARAGRGDRTRLERLRDRLELGQIAATGSAAGAAAVESIARLLG